MVNYTKEDISFVKNILVDLLSTPTPSGHEEPGVDLLVEILNSIGFKNKIKLEYLGDRSYNIIINDIKNPEYLIATHIDTIPILTKTKIINEFYIKGTGAIDAKGSVAAIVFALKNLNYLPSNFSVAIFSQEESTGGGSVSYLKNHSPKRALIMEPTSLEIATSGNGFLTLRVKAYGEYSHPNAPISARKDSAIIKAVNIIKTMKEYFESRGMQIGILRIHSDAGGFIIPKECEFEVDVNIPPGNRALDLLKEMRQLIENKDYEVLLLDFADPFINRDISFEKALKEVYKSILGREAKIISIPAWTDANNLYDFGVNSIVFGPGDFNLAHTEKEFVDIRDIILAGSFIKEFILYIDSEGYKTKN